jgi:hypothetical protein
MSPASWGTEAGIGTIVPGVEIRRTEGGPALARGAGPRKARRAAATERAAGRARRGV